MRVVVKVPFIMEGGRNFQVFSCEDSYVFIRIILGDLARCSFMVRCAIHFVVVVGVVSGEQQTDVPSIVDRQF